MAKNKQGGRGGKHRKTGDWVAITKGRENRRNERELISRSNRDIPSMGQTGSAAYRRLTGQQ
jgi:hypothetical protein